MAVQFYNLFINLYITEQKHHFKASTFETVVRIVMRPKTDTYREQIQHGELTAFPRQQVSIY